MKATFKIHYRAHEGAKLQIIGDEGRVIDMACIAGDFWSVTADVSRARGFNYRYRVVEGRRCVRTEWGAGHSLPEIDEQVDIVVCDHWCDAPHDRVFNSSMFAETIFARQAERRPSLIGAKHYIEVEAPLRPSENLYIIGSSAELGEWQTERACKMTYLGSYRWGVVLKGTEHTEYKFIVKGASGEFLRWEQGANHLLPAVETLHLTLGLRMRDTVMWRGAGVAVPLFSLRSDSGFGVGEFLDLKYLVDWCAECGQSVIQLLPVNDTSELFTWSDSYPYNASSSFALHPIYIRLSEVGYLRGDADRVEMEEMQRELNGCKDLDYERVIKAKMKYLRMLYKQLGERLMQSKSYKDFEKHNRAWLMPYAVFSTLRDKYNSADFNAWSTFSKFNEKRCAAYAERNSYEVGFYCYVQYHLDRQLRKMRDYAHSRGVVLKGDIPIGVSPTSVDVWQYPDIFTPASSAGAPPDDFAAEGQNWGFPIYNWEKMAENDYAWWRARFAKMSEYFDAYRIDHILGMFRIWSIPQGAKSALLGEFMPSLPYSAEEIRSNGFDFDIQRDVALNRDCEDTLWLPYSGAEELYYPRIKPFDTPRFSALDAIQRDAFTRLHDEFYYHRNETYWAAIGAERLRKLVASTSMLACGEDLGMIPSCVPQVMSAEQVLSLEVERMPKAYGVRYADVMNYPYRAVATTSTHDMSPLRLWWRDEAEREFYYNEVLGLEGDAPQETTAELCESIVVRHLASPAILTILPLQDWLALSEELRSEDIESERVNIPADSNHHWRYRMHLTLEELLERREFSAHIATLIAESSR